MKERKALRIDDKVVNPLKKLKMNMLKEIFQ